MTKYMKTNVKDPELVKRLIPNYEVGAKIFFLNSSCNVTELLIENRNL